MTTLSKEVIEITRFVNYFVFKQWNLEQSGYVRGGSMIGTFEVLAETTLNGAEFLVIKNIVNDTIYQIKPSKYVNGLRE